MIIRSATLEDIPQLSQLKQPKDEQHRLENEKIARERVEQSDGKNMDVLVLEINHKVMGQVVIRYKGTKTEPGYPNLQDIFIDHRQRKKGFGTKLIRHCEQFLSQKDFTKVGVQVNPELNCKAHKLYTKLGFKDVGRKPYLDGTYDGEEDWVIDMVKELG